MIANKNSNIRLEAAKMLGERLKLLREERELTQQQLAEAINSTQQKISNYEKNIVEPDCETLVSLANFFETSTDYILGRTNVMSPIKMNTTHRYDELLSNLPETAIKELESYIEYIKYKYKNWEKKNPAT